MALHWSRNLLLRLFLVAFAATPLLAACDTPRPLVPLNGGGGAGGSAATGDTGTGGAAIKGTGGASSDGG
jgi:hypothetical protein